MFRPILVTTWISATLIFLAAILSCRPPVESDPNGAVVETAQTAVQRFKQELKSALIEGMAEGPQAAIDACRLKAPGIAVALDSENFHIGRTSHRLRNPANAPKPWMLPLLETLHDGAPGNPPFQSVRIDSEWVGYAEAIYVEPLCLTCHGDNLPPAVSGRLHSGYPEDQAIDYSVGDFRGIFWAEVRSASPTPHRAP